MQLCDYGCGREAKYPFKNGKWCCSKSYKSCPEIRKKISIKIKESWQDPNSGLNSDSRSIKISNSNKDLWEDPNSVFNSISCKEKRSNTMKKLRKDPNSKYHSISYKKNLSNSMKEIWKDPNSGLNSDIRSEKISNIMKNAWKNPDGVLNSSSYREKRSDTMTEFWKDPNSKYNSNSCKEKQSNNTKEAWADPNSELNLISKETRSNNTKEAWADPNSGFNSNSCKEKMIKSHYITIEQIKERYPFFSKIEELRYNSDKPDEKEIQVHCINHNCKNSKEKGGWFTPTYIQLYERIRHLEKDYVNDGCYLYCSQYCKDTCPLYNLYSDPYRDTGKPYTSGELDVFNKHILKRDNEICYYCSDHHATIVHHLRPQKLEPFFALDPDYAISVCKKCHYKYGHPTGSPHSTGNLAKIICSVESQKFLNQKLENI